MFDKNDDLELGKENKVINVLTILTIIGSLVIVILMLFGEFTMDKSYDQYVMVLEGGTTGMESMDNMLINSWDSFQIQYQYRYELLFTGSLGLLLCILGAVLMRKGNIKGLWLWLVGEWLPLIVSVTIVGAAMFQQGWQSILAVIPIAFTVLYFAHKKHLA